MEKVILPKEVMAKLLGVLNNLPQLIDETQASIELVGKLEDLVEEPKDDAS